jgi:GH15 family glucan-1,4-alpha-glucosidase
MPVPEPVPIRPHVLRNYAFLGDGERGAVVGPDGGIVWLCFPFFDSDSIFTSLIGGRGTYVIRPTSTFVWGGRYEERSLVWRSRWVTADGIVESREALVFPGDQDRAVLLRQIIGQQGENRVVVDLDPRGSYGRAGLDDLRPVDGSWLAHTGDVHLRWTAPEGVTCVDDDDGPRLHLELTVTAGDRFDCVLELSTRPIGSDPVDPDAAWRATETGWSHRPTTSGLIADRDAAFAYTVLRGLSGDGGGMVAAATTSLPERADEGRSYDYRYAWIRDQSFAGQALAAVGADALLERLTGFVVARVLTDGPGLHPAYTARGGVIPEQGRLGLPGYPGGTDVIGNHVRDQFQLDTFGEALLLIAAAAQRDVADVDTWRAAEVVADAIALRWTEPGHGIWELGERRWTHSRLTCVAGLRAAAGAVGPGPLASTWVSLADGFAADVAATSVGATGAWRRSPDDDTVDAALLLPTIRGAVAPTDPRAIATYREVERALVDDGYVYRYHDDAMPLGDDEGAFMLCGFSMALAALQQGDVAAAVHYFDRNRSACGSPGVFTEEFDVTERQLRGNLPQAFVHALLLETAVALTHALDAGEPALRRPR